MMSGRKPSAIACPRPPQLGLYPIVTFEKQLLNMIGKMV
jgi:hypothetical protein